MAVLLTSAALAWALLLPAQTRTGSAGVGRWIDLQTGTLSARYRTIENSLDVRTINQLQYAGLFRGRFRFDPAGRLTLNAAYGTGTNFIGSWNNTSIGTGSFVGRWRVKQLYVAWVPAGGVDLSFGSMGFVRGASTEITTFDNDGYLAGERITLRRPKELLVDELTVTRGFVGDLDEPSVFNRLNRLTGGRNYYQVLASRTFGAAVSASGDYSRLSGVPHLRLAVAARTPALRAIDSIRLEHYSRFGDDPESGFALFAEKTVRRLNIGAGYADIDPRYRPINADRFASGKRLYATAAARLTTDLTASVFITRAVDSDFPNPIGERLDVAVVYDVLGRLRRAKLFR